MTKQLSGVFLLLTMAIACKTSYRSDKEFVHVIGHTVFFDKGPRGKDKFSWSSVKTFKPFSIVYQPEKQHIIFNRPGIPDTFHRIQLTEDQLRLITKSYGKFRFFGAFECHDFPPEFTSLMYVNPSNNDLMEITKMTSNVKGDEIFKRAVIYQSDTINYMHNSSLFAKPDELKQ